MHHALTRQIFIGLIVSWLLVLVAEGWSLADGGKAVRAAQRELMQKRTEIKRLGTLDPAPTAEQAVRIATALAAARETLDRLNAEVRGGEGAPSGPSGTSDAAESRRDASAGGEDLVHELHERARLAGVEVRPDEQFGIVLAGRGTGTPALTATQWRQREAIAFLVRALLAAHPSQLLSVQCGRPRGSTSGGALTRLSSGDVGAEAGVPFDLDQGRSVADAGVVETVPVRLTFIARTAALRQFLNQLWAGHPFVAFSEIAVEPIAETGAPHHGKASEAEQVVQVVQPALSQFVVTVEYCELVAWPAADDGTARVGACISASGGEPAGARSSSCAWRVPAPQSRGRGWIYEVFTPPAVFRDAISGAIAAVPAEEATLVDPGAPTLDLQLLQVKKRPFRLRLVGFAGESPDLRGIFADAVGKTVIGRQGQRLVAHRVWLDRLSLDRAGTGSKGNGGPVAMAMVTDEGTGEKIVLTTRGPSPAGAPVGLFASRKNPVSRRALEEGESAVFGGVRYRVERIEYDPALAVVTCVSADGARATGHALLPQDSTDAHKGMSSPPATENTKRDFSATTPGMGGTLMPHAATENTRLDIPATP